MGGGGAKRRKTLPLSFGHVIQVQMKGDKVFVKFEDKSQYCYLGTVQWSNLGKLPNLGPS